MKTFEKSESRGVCLMIFLALQGTKGQNRMMILPAFQPETILMIEQSGPVTSSVITYIGGKNQLPMYKAIYNML